MKCKPYCSLKQKILYRKPFVFVYFFIYNYIHSINQYLDMYINISYA